MNDQSVIRQRINSIILVSYMLVAFLSYMIDALRSASFVVLLIISFVAIIYSNRQQIGEGIRINPKQVFPIIFLFFVGLFIQLFNGTFTPLFFFFLAAPCFAYFIYHNKFNIKILSFPIYILSGVFIIYFIIRGSLYGVFPSMSTNYISVVMIMNVALLQMVALKQREAVSIYPAVFALLLSLPALGRSGILCSLILLLNAIWINWSELSKSRKTKAFFLVFIPVSLILVSQWNSLVPYFDQLSYMQKFYERGFDSPSRDILMTEYLNNINPETLFWGYNYTKNTWFIHYGLNPHNSYIRLHHYLGVLFFIIVPLLIISSFKLIRRSKFLFVIFAAVLLRAWTDSFLFLSIYDFVILTLILLSVKERPIKLPEVQRS